ncbi:MAG: tetratricopeptide repeat protein [Planctomycetes bacterium]|nr:tetratricopeptide repeat protein [Planctomycetota bacterium]
MWASRAGLALLALSMATSALAQQQRSDASSPAAVAVFDDTATRGHWQGAYGSYVHALGAMKGYSPLFGGPGWPCHFHITTGNPKDRVRVWPSPFDYALDDRALFNPVKGVHTGGAFDDHGEAYPLGQGPDLFVQVALPQGRYLLSLYFFEIDWIQYRAYDLRLYDDKDKLLAQTDVSDFFEGKYKRFLVDLPSPRGLKLHIARKGGPNAILCGLFLDKLSPIRPFPLALGQSRDARRRWSPALDKPRGRLMSLVKPQNEKGARFWPDHRKDLQDIRAGLERFLKDDPGPMEAVCAHWVLSECCEELLDLAASREQFQRFLAAFAAQDGNAHSRAELLRELAEGLRLDAETWRVAAADVAYVEELAKSDNKQLTATEARRLARQHFSDRDHSGAVRLYGMMLDAMTDTTELDDALSLAKALEEIGDYRVAAQRYEWICQAYPDSDRMAEAWHGLYWTWFVLADYAKSRAALEKLIAEGPIERVNEYKVLLAKNRLLAGERDQAKQMLEALLRSDAFAKDAKNRAFAQAWLRNVQEDMARNAIRAGSRTQAGGK